MLELNIIYFIIRPIAHVSANSEHTVNLVHCGVTSEYNILFTLLWKTVIYTTSHYTVYTAQSC